MLRLGTAALGTTLALAMASPAAAHPNVPLSPADPTGVAYTATDNVEFIARFPEHTGTAGGRLLGDRFYLTDPRGVYVYDVSTPEAPELLGSLALPQAMTGAALAQEDPDTDGDILLVDAVDPADPSGAYRLQVVDVSDPAAMEVIGSVGFTDHTWTCVSTPTDGCAYAYGRSGHIIDLTDPTDPKRVPVSWRQHVGLENERPNRDGTSNYFKNDPYTHDLTEFRTGRVMSAGKHNVLMDTTDPANPRPITDLVVAYHSYGYHSVEWANEGRDSIMVAGTEIAPAEPTGTIGGYPAGTDCQGKGSWISTYDATDVVRADRPLERGGKATGAKRNAEFRLLDTYHVGGRGIFLDGNAPAHTLYCAHWMELEPDFDNGGRMVAGYYDWGARFVDIASDGTMSEIGWYLPVDGYTGSAQWITDEIVYVMDYRRGLEVIRISDEPATGVVTVGGQAAPGGFLSTLTASIPHVHGDSAIALLFASVAAVALGLSRRRRPVTA